MLTIHVNDVMLFVLKLQLILKKTPLSKKKSLCLFYMYWYIFFSFWSEKQVYVTIWHKIAKWLWDVCSDGDVSYQLCIKKRFVLKRTVYLMLLCLNERMKYLDATSIMHITWPPCTWPSFAWKEEICHTPAAAAAVHWIKQTSILDWHTYSNF